MTHLYCTARAKLVVVTGAHCVGVAIRERPRRVRRASVKPLTLTHVGEFIAVTRKRAAADFATKPFAHSFAVGNGVAPIHTDLWVIPATRLARAQHAA